MTKQEQMILYRLFKQGYKIFIHNLLVESVYPVRHNNETFYMYDSDKAKIIEGSLDVIDLEQVDVYQLVEWRN